MITPGFKIPMGSASDLSLSITAKAASPHSSFTNGAICLPVPCSALSDPPYLSMINFASSLLNASKTDKSFCVLTGCVIKKWRFPSLA